MLHHYYIILYYIILYYAILSYLKRTLRTFLRKRIQRKAHLLGVRCRELFGNDAFVVSGACAGALRGSMAPQLGNSTTLT